jgi:hypothetical protein
MSKGDPPEQGLLGVAERIPPSHALVKATLKSLGVPEPETTAKLLKQGGLSLTPISTPPIKWKALPRPPSSQPVIDSSPPVVPTTSIVVCEGALLRYASFVLLPFRYLSHKTGYHPWRPVRAFFFWAARHWAFRKIFYGVVLIVGVVTKSAVLDNTQAPPPPPPLPPTIETGSNPAPKAQVKRRKAPATEKPNAVDSFFDDLKRAFSPPNKR